MRYIIFILLSLAFNKANAAQRFFNLTADEVSVGTAAPRFAYAVPLSGQYADSVYTATILYPEFIDMPESDIEKYKKLSPEQPNSMPDIVQRVVLSRKKPSFEIEFCPVVFRYGRYKLLVSFMLKLESKPIRRAAKAKRAAEETDPSNRYASHSVLAKGKWAKIRIPSTGVYQLTQSLARQAGFSDLSKVKIYGYGGNLQNETLDPATLAELDDLKEVPTCEINGKRLFHGLGPVSWSSEKASRRTRNPYSDYGYYFLTQSDEEPQKVDSAAFVSSFYPSADYYHTLHETDGYSWYHGGRNLFDPQAISANSPQNITLSGNANTPKGILSVNVSSGKTCQVQIEVNDSVVGTINVSVSTSETSYDQGQENSATYTINNLKASNNIRLTLLSGGPARLDYASIAWNKALPLTSLSSSDIPVPQYVYNITNQDHHADGQADMVIIIPTSQKLRQQAERLKAFHESRDNFRVNIVPADELYNEFSSGTPDASAYRRYMKMLYDRASSDADMPRYLILFGDCVWDNRMLTNDCKNLIADDYLLCYESENSFNKVECFVDDGFYCYLDDGEGSSPLLKDKLDVAVGRFPVTTEAQAKVMVDKTIAYAENKNAGAWQNTIMFMGDDGDFNTHIQDADNVANQVIGSHPEFLVKKVMWDAYTRQSSSTGNSYPDVTRIIKQQQAAGALIMDYAGHGKEDQISHETVLRLTDFAGFTNANLPLWITASCDIMPFDGTTPNIGETAVLNDKGGAFAFYGTTRTVYASYNEIMNSNFLKYALQTANGKTTTLGEAQRLSKNDVKTNGNSEVVNNLQYSLLGDPAISLCLPTKKAIIDSIGNVATTSGAMAALKAGSLVTIKGHVEDAPGFNGTVTLTVRDCLEEITCKGNDKKQTPDPYIYEDRPKTLYSGSNNVKDGKFEITFAVPLDISYSGKTGMINVYAVSDDHKTIANGCNEQFTVGGDNTEYNDSIGPSIYCYLNSPSFVNGGDVNPTPYFAAQITDKDGINASGSGIGHDMQLIIDGDMEKSYNLNENFAFDFGSYTNGKTYYNIPELAEGEHKLQFRAWDIMNNLSIAELKFRVVKGLTPSFSASCSDNPAKSSTTFIVSHDRTGSNMDILIEVFDMSGRKLWSHEDNGVGTNEAYVYEWNLTNGDGGKLRTGVYLYRVSMSSDGSTVSSKAKKLIIIGNN